MIANRAMQRLLEGNPGAAEVDVPSELRLLVAGGFKQVEGCFFLRALFDHAFATGVARFEDETGYEASINSVHVEDYLPRGAAREPVSLALTGRACARFYASKLREYASSLLSHPAFRVIVSVSGRACTIRFHAIREGQSWLAANLDGYEEAVLFVDSEPGGGNRVAHVFGARRVLLPVVHPVGERTARASIQAVIDAGCKGVFLINQGMTTDQVLALVMTVRRDHPTLWVGVNLLGTRPSEVLRRGLETLDGRLDGIWTDNAGVDGAPDNLELAEEFVATRRELGWDGLYFGGVAFKYQPEVSPERLAEVASTASALMDVVCTSGPGTGKAADVAKIERMRAAMGEAAALALASGVDTSNVGNYLPYVDAYLVGTSLETEFGVIDPLRVEELQARIKQSRWT